MIRTAQQGIESLKKAGAGIPTILVLAPLSGDFSEYGIEAVQGVLLAHELAGLEGKIKIRIEDDLRMNHLLIVFFFGAFFIHNF